MFLFKRKEVIVDCFTYSDDAYKYAQINKASNYIPKWFYQKHQLEIDGMVANSVKNCPALTSYFNKGFIMPMWCDVSIVSTLKDFKVVFANPGYNFEQHPTNQWENFKDASKEFHIKLLSPWVLKSKDDTEFLLTKPQWRKSNDLDVLTGVVNYKHQHGTHVNMFLPIANKTYDIKYNEPLIHIIPLTEKNVVLKHHLIDKKEWDKIHIAKLHFRGNYNKVSKCPFHK